jgi:hypothetical protein
MRAIRKTLGWLVVIGIAGLMIFAGGGKVFGFAPPEVTEGLKKYGLAENILLIGWGEITAALLLLLPHSASLGVLMTSAFWGGAICLHMSHREPYWLQSVLLALTWLGATLRDRRTLQSFTDPWGG